MALKPILKFRERALSNYRIATATMVAGTLVGLDTADATPVGVGDTPYGSVKPIDVSAAGDREMGVLFYDVTTNGVTLFEQLSMILDYGTKVNTPCAVWHFDRGAEFETTSYLASGTGSLTAGAASGNTAIGTLLGIKAGQYVIASAFTATNPGSVICAKLVGNGMINGVQSIRVQVL